MEAKNNEPQEKYGTGFNDANTFCLVFVNNHCDILVLLMSLFLLFLMLYIANVVLFIFPNLNKICLIICLIYEFSEKNADFDAQL